MIGGVAAALHGSDQLTLDLDIVHQSSDDNIGRLVNALTELQAVRTTLPDRPTPPSAEELTFRVERFVSPVGNIDVFVEVRSVGGYDEFLTEADRISLADGIVIRVASIEHIIQSKAGSGRAKDPNHIRSLERIRQELSRPPASDE